LNIESLIKSAEFLRDKPPALPQSEKDAWVLSWPSPLPKSTKELVELIREQHCQLLTRFEDFPMAGVSLGPEERHYYWFFYYIAKTVNCDISDAYFADTYAEDVQFPAFPYYDVPQHPPDWDWVLFLGM
jgi:hypothetical protein